MQLHQSIKQGDGIRGRKFICQFYKDATVYNTYRCKESKRKALKPFTVQRKHCVNIQGLQIFLLLKSVQVKRVERITDLVRIFTSKIGLLGAEKILRCWPLTQHWQMPFSQNLEDFVHFQMNFRGR